MVFRKSFSQFSSESAICLIREIRGLKLRQELFEPRMTRICADKKKETSVVSKSSGSLLVFVRAFLNLSSESSIRLISEIRGLKTPLKNCLNRGNADRCG